MHRLHPALQTLQILTSVSHRKCDSYHERGEGFAREFGLVIAHELHGFRKPLLPTDGTTRHHSPVWDKICDIFHGQHIHLSSALNQGFTNRFSHTGG